jgi:orotate phosphoribosyltransferase
MSSARQDLLRLLAAKSFRLGQFKLSSGATSDYYIDCRTTTLAAKGARLTGQVFLDEIRARQWKPKAIGGLTMGADPIVVAVSVASGDIEGFLIRKAEKQHGTGSSTIQAIEAAREFGFQVVGVMCLVERQEAGGRPDVEKAASPAPFVSIYKAADVRQEHLLQNDETSPGMPAVGVGCEICGRPAVVHSPRIRCEAHKT